MSRLVGYARVSTADQSLGLQVDALKKAGVLDDNIDTATPAGRLLLGVLGVLAQFERDLIAERTRAGMAKRKAEGVKFGAPTKVDVKKARALLRAGKSVEEVTTVFRCSKAAIYRYFDAPTVWLLQGRDPKDYPRDVSREKWAAAKLAARKK